MNLRNARVVLRLRTLPDLLDLALRVCVDASGVYQKLGLALLLPAFGACLLLRYLGEWSWWAIWPTAISLAAVAQGAFTVAVGQLMFEDAATARTLLGRFARRLPSYLWAMFWTRLLPGAFLFGIFLVREAPAVMVIGFLLAGLLLVRWAFLHEALLLEGSRVGEATKRSSRIIRQHSGAVMGLLFWQLGAMIAFTVGADLIGQGVVHHVLQLGQPLGSLWDEGGSVFALAGLFLAVPFTTTARFLQYIDLRTRKEGWDIQLKFTAIQAEAADRRMAA